MGLSATTAAQLDDALHAEQACYWLGLLPEDRELTYDDTEAVEVARAVVAAQRESRARERIAALGRTLGKV